MERFQVLLSSSGKDAEALSKLIREFDPALTARQARSLVDATAGGEVLILRSDSESFCDSFAMRARAMGAEVRTERNDQRPRAGIPPAPEIPQSQGMGQSTLNRASVARGVAVGLVLILVLIFASVRSASNSHTGPIDPNDQRPDCHAEALSYASNEVDGFEWNGAGMEVYRREYESCLKLVAVIGD